MDALTFLLDTVTPVWRTYGKRIGEDVRDFLIVPVYRNEFTGEPKRYPITSLPRRSFRHWVMLLLLPATIITITVLQVRTALVSAAYYALPGIAHPVLWWVLLPWFWLGMLVQWFAVLVELCILGLQVAITVWWIGWMVGLIS